MPHGRDAVRRGIGVRACRQPSGGPLNSGRDTAAAGMRMAREITLALSRAMERKRTHFPHHRIAQFIGDAGTAGALATLAWITHEMRVERQAGQTGSRRIGRIGLLHFSEDDGQRSALMLCARGLGPEITREGAHDTA